jgi:hypothetical protein
MSKSGQSRHFDRAPLASGLPQLDILRVIRHVRKVPHSDMDRCRAESLVVISPARRNPARNPRQAFISKPSLVRAWLTQWSDDLKGRLKQEGYPHALVGARQLPG